MTGMSRDVGRVLALLVVALVVAVCLTSGVEASPVVHHECSALTAEQTALLKPTAPAPGFSAVAIDVPLQIDPPALPSGELLALSPQPPPAAAPGGLGSRSPPASLSSHSI